MGIADTIKGWFGSGKNTNDGQQPKNLGNPADMGMTSTNDTLDLGRDKLDGAGDMGGGSAGMDGSRSDRGMTGDGQDIDKLGKRIMGEGDVEEPRS